MINEIIFNIIYENKCFFDYEKSHLLIKNHFEKDLWINLKQDSNKINDILKNIEISIYKKENKILCLSKYEDMFTILELNEEELKISKNIIKEVRKSIKKSKKSFFYNKELHFIAKIELMKLAYSDIKENVFLKIDHESFKINNDMLITLSKGTNKDFYLHAKDKNLEIIVTNSRIHCNDKNIQNLLCNNEDSDIFKLLIDKDLSKITRIINFIRNEDDRNRKLIL